MSRARWQVNSRHFACPYWLFFQVSGSRQPEYPKGTVCNGFISVALYETFCRVFFANLLRKCKIRIDGVPSSTPCSAGVWNLPTLPQNDNQLTRTHSTLATPHLFAPPPRLEFVHFACGALGGGGVARGGRSELVWGNAHQRSHRLKVLFHVRTHVLHVQNLLDGRAHRRFPAPRALIQSRLAASKSVQVALACSFFLLINESLVVAAAWLCCEAGLSICPNPRGSRTQTSNQKAAGVDIGVGKRILGW